MVAVLPQSDAFVDDNEQYCPSCGNWVTSDEFNGETGWCIECSPVSPLCANCGVVLRDQTRTMCHACRTELWLERHSDDLELLIVTKSYSVTQARIAVTKMVRPICHCCGKPIKGGTPGESMFCKSNKKCHSMYGRYRRLLKRGLTIEAALATLKGHPKQQGGTVGTITRGATL